MTGIGRTRLEQIRFMRERAEELLAEAVLLEKRIEAAEVETLARRPSGMALIRAAVALDAAASEYRELAEKWRDGTRDGDEQASGRHLYASNCAQVAAWLRQLVQDAGPGA